MYKHATRRHHAHHSEYDLQADLQKIKDALVEAGSDVKGRAGEMLTQSFDGVKEKTINFRDMAQEYVTEKPFTSVGIATLVGMFIGFLANRS